jgi:putative Mg2+ transporter-C (MgtC) family protein
LPSDLTALLPVLQLDLLVRLALAVVLGGLIGLEREWAGKPAGLRTNILICLGSALFTDLSIATALEANVANQAAAIEFRADPARIAAQIISGIGFLGAGAIIESRGSVTGLTTAATIWVVAAVGMAVGAGAYVSAIGATALVLFVLFPLRYIERYVARALRGGEQDAG